MSLRTRLQNIPFWSSQKLPGRWVLDRKDGLLRTREVYGALVLHPYRSAPALVLQGKSSDWAQELHSIQKGEFFEFYEPSEGDVVVSVGAGIGTEAFLASRRVGKNGQVLAIEGDPGAFQQLTLGVAMNDLRNVYPFFGLVTDRIDWLQFGLGEFAGKDFTTSSILSQEKSIPLLGFTLDEILKLAGVKHMDLLLMNIEGAELMALQGLSVLPKRLVVSCHDFLGIPEAKTFDQVKQWLRDRNYALRTYDSDPNRPWREYYLFGEILDN